jgi:hypothetical protein
MCPSSHLISVFLSYAVAIESEGMQASPCSLPIMYIGLWRPFVPAEQSLLKTTVEYLMTPTALLTRPEYKIVY